MITKSVIGKIEEQEITEYTIRNSNGMFVGILNYGGIVSKILARDRLNDLGDVVLGFETLDGYVNPKNPYIGALVGRFANRINSGKFVLEGKSYQLAGNNNGNALHGGIKGFDKVVWHATTDEKQPQSVHLSYDSKDGEEGYPGNLHVEVTYTLNDGNELKIEYKATTDQPTPVNLTNHSYFNLSAGLHPVVLNHELSINADAYTIVGSNLIPTGELRSVHDNAFNFLQPKKIGSAIAEVEGGYDHNFILNKSGNELSLAATLYDEKSGRFMEMFTTEPGVQFYSGNFLDGTLKGKGGRYYEKHAGLCLEAQHFPDSPNQPAFPNTVLRPGETYRQTTVYKFSVK